MWFALTDVAVVTVAILVVLEQRLYWTKVQLRFALVRDVLQRPFKLFYVQQLESQIALIVCEQLLL